MLSPKPSNPNRDYAGCRDDALRAKYPASGLYSVNDSANPLWTVDFWMYKDTFHISGDGNYLVHVGGSIPYAKADSEILTFYAKGKLTRLYTLQEVVSDVRILPRYFTEYIWLSQSLMSHSDNTLILKTKVNQEFTYDIVTGDRIAKTFGYYELDESSEMAQAQSQSAAIPEQTESNIGWLIYITIVALVGFWWLLNPSVPGSPKKRS
jgi:hypothetical protein